jgi:hypothetical protein
MVTRKNVMGRFGSAAAGKLLVTAGATRAARQRRLDAARLHVRRLEPEEVALRRQSPAHQQLSDGDFAVIGTAAAEALERELPADAARADYERIVVVNRETLIRARADVPDA